MVTCFSSHKFSSVMPYLLGAVVCLAATAARAIEPMAVVSVSSVQELLDDASYLSKLASAEDAGKFGLMIINDVPLKCSRLLFY